MRLPFNIFPFACLLCFPFLGLAQEIRFTAVVPPKDNGNVTVNGMVQDAQGYLWLATTNGLYQYDGSQYRSYHYEPLNTHSPAAINIECIGADKDGCIWLAPRCTGLDRFDPVSGRFTHFRHRDNDPGSLINDSVWVIMHDHEGTMWIGTSGGLEQFDGKTNTFHHYRHIASDNSSLSFNTVRAIYEDKQETIWVGTGDAFILDNRKSEGGLNKFERKTGKFTRYLHEEKDTHSLVDNRVGAIFEDSRGNFWIGTAGDGLHTMDRTKGRFERHLYDPLHPDRLSRPPVNNTLPYGVDHITFITEDIGGRIWIGTFEGGINVFDPATQSVSHYGGGKDDREKVQDNVFWAVCKTKDNILWISSWDNNLYKIKPTPDILPHIRMNNLVVYFAEDDTGNLWVTTSNGLVRKSPDGREETFFIDKVRSSRANEMYDIEKNGNTFWITAAGGLYLFDPVTGRFSHFAHQPNNPNSIGSDTVFSVRSNPDGTLWVCTVGGLDLLDIKTGNFRHFRNPAPDKDRPAQNRVFSVTTDKKQGLWICTSAGIGRPDKDSGFSTRYLRNSDVTNIFEDKEGDLWAATSAGLYRYDTKTDSFYRFSVESAALNPTWVYWILEDRQRNLWLSTSGGIMKLNKERSNAIVYGRNQGVNSVSLSGAGYERQNGELLFPDATGYFCFSPGLLTKNIPAPVVSLRTLLLNNVAVTPSPTGLLTAPLAQTSEIRLGHTQNTFSFEFTNIDFSSEPGDTRLLYMLENYDNTWRKAGEERTAYYFNLPAGYYRFRVKAFNSAGISTGKAIAVTITPPLWKTWPAYSLYVILAGGIFYGLYRIRFNQFRRSQVGQITAMVATQEEERKRISRELHDGIGTRLSALKMFLSLLHEKALDANNAEITSLADSSGQLIADAIQDTRRLLSNLSPAMLEEFGYMTAVEGMINKINDAKQMQFELVVFGMKHRLPKDQELSLFRITQELVANVLKHSGARNASLQIGERDKKIIVMIEDDGKGFDVHEHKNGYGLQNLDARTRLMNGTLTIDSRPGAGTSVWIEIPDNFNTV